MANVIDDGGYTYDPENETWRCKHCDTIFGCGEDDDPDAVKEMHEAICDEIAEANERLREARALSDPYDNTGLISGGY